MLRSLDLIRSQPVWRFVRCRSGRFYGRIYREQSKTDILTLLNCTACYQKFADSNDEVWSLLRSVVNVKLSVLLEVWVENKVEETAFVAHPNRVERVAKEYALSQNSVLVSVLYLKPEFTLSARHGR